MTTTGAIEPRHFAQPPLVRTLAIWGAVVSVIAAATVAWLLVEGVMENRPLIVLSFAFCVVSLVVSILMLRSAKDTFVAAEDGLWCHSPGRESVFLAWDEIGDVYPENVMQRLVVTDRAGRRRMAVEFHLRGFGELRRIILERSRN